MNKGTKHGRLIMRLSSSGGGYPSKSYFYFISDGRIVEYSGSSYLLGDTFAETHKMCKKILGFDDIIEARGYYNELMGYPEHEYETIGGGKFQLGFATCETDYKEIDFNKEILPFIREHRINQICTGD